MSDTVKLIIEIPKEIVDDLKETYKGDDVLYCAVKYGTPLDDVKAEIKQLRSHSARFRTSDGGVAYADSQDILEILDNIGK